MLDENERVEVYPHDLPAHGPIGLGVARCRSSERCSQAARGSCRYCRRMAGGDCRQHLILKIEQSAESALQGTIISVDQGNVSIPVDAVSFARDGALRLDLKSIGAVYE